jgi:hypothetical protein
VPAFEHLFGRFEPTDSEVVDWLFGQLQKIGWVVDEASGQLTRQATDPYRSPAGPTMPIRFLCRLGTIYTADTLVQLMDGIETQGQVDFLMSL